MSRSAGHHAGCLICGADLVYTKEARRVQCALCEEEFSSPAECASGHFVCDRCHGLPALELIERTCLTSLESDPLQLATSLMGHPAIKMHGPEHHFLVPAVLIASYHAVHGEEGKAERIAAARRRAEQVKGGFCGFLGTCGAAMGAGIACSVLTGATPLARDEWRLANLMTAACLTAIGEAGGPRCCKRDTYLALRVGIDFLNRHLDAGLPSGDSPLCAFAAQNRECLATECPFFPPPRKPLPNPTETTD